MSKGILIIINCFCVLLDLVIAYQNLSYNFHRKISGAYCCCATNRHGSGKGTFEILVKSAPTPPQGPLEVKDIHGSGCNLVWGASVDNGGTNQPVTYVVEMRNPSKGDWCQMGKVGTTHMSVSGLEEDSAVEFRVRAVNEVGESDYLHIPRRVEIKSQFCKLLLLNYVLRIIGAVLETQFFLQPYLCRLAARKSWTGLTR